MQGDDQNHKGYDYPSQSQFLNPQAKPTQIGDNQLTFPAAPPAAFASAFTNVENPMNESFDRSHLSNSTIPNPLLTNTVSLNNSRMSPSKQQLSNSKKAIFSGQSKYPNLLQQPSIQNKQSSQEYTKVNPFSEVYQSQLAHQIGGNPSHICNYSSGAKQEEEYYFASYLFVFEIMLEFTLVLMYLTIFLPCYILTLPVQCKKMPKRYKKICNCCADVINYAEINKTSTPQILMISLKVGGILLFFLLWKLMDYPFFVVYYRLLRYIFSLIVDFYTNFVSFS